MKVLLANPATRESLNSKYERFFIKAGSRWPWSTVKKKGEKNTSCFFPFYLAYTASILRDEGHDVRVIDGVALDMTRDHFLGMVYSIRPDAIVIEIQTHAFRDDMKLCEEIKSANPHTKIILTGPHATVFAKDILENHSIIDFVALGEYEYTVSKIIARLESYQDDFRMDGAACRTERGIWISKKKGFIEDINNLPSPAFDLFPSNENPALSIYGDGICTYHPAVTLHSSRGCPFGCDFCLWNQIMYDNGKYRMFDPQRVVDEMEHVINTFGAKEIYFDDDDFCVNKKHVLDICGEIKRRNIRIKWSCMGDAMCTDEEMIRAMAGAGCIFMKFGVESGSRKILKNIGKPLNPEKAVMVSELCRKYGIRTHATFSFGLDGDTMETMGETLRLANRIKFDYAQASITTPFPGTRYYDKLAKNGSIKDIDFDKFDGTSSCTFSTSSLTARQIERFRKKAIRSMIFHKIIDPVWVSRQIGWNIMLLRNQGVARVLAPVKALYNMFAKPQN